MKGMYDFIVEPLGERYDNTIKVGDVDLVVNTNIESFKSVNNVAVVLALPKAFKTDICIGDQIMIHHNVFRRFYDMRGKEKNSRSYLEEDKYIVSEDQIFLYKQKEYKAMPGFSFVKPLKAIDNFNIEDERPLIGVVKYSDGTFNKEELVGFRPGSQYEFIIDNERLYRVMNNFITIKYEYQGNEEEYNPSWAQGS